MALAPGVRLGPYAIAAQGSERRSRRPGGRSRTRRLTDATDRRVLSAVVPGLVADAVGPSRADPPLRAAPICRRLDVVRTPVGTHRAMPHSRSDERAQQYGGRTPEG